MSKLTINSVYTKEQIYPMLLNFQDGYQSEDLKVDCVLLQDEDGRTTVVGELDGLLYAGDEEKDLGQTFILARNRKTGNVRLIETGRADLKPVKNCTIQQLDSRLLESASHHIQQSGKSNQTETEIEPPITLLQGSCVLNSDVPKHPDTSESLARPIYPRSLGTSESYTTPNSPQLLETGDTIPDGEKSPHPIKSSDPRSNIQSLKHTEYAVLTELELDKPNHLTQPENKLDKPNQLTRPENKLKSKRKHSQLEKSEPKPNQTELREPSGNPSVVSPKHRLQEISALEATLIHTQKGNQSELKSCNNKLNKENSSQCLEKSELEHNVPNSQIKTKENPNGINNVQHMTTNVMEPRPNFPQLPTANQRDSKDYQHQNPRVFKSNVTDANDPEKCKETIIANGSEPQMGKHNLETKKSQKYTHPGETELALDKNISEECMHYPDILENADINTSIEEQEISDGIFTSTEENNSKYNHIMNSYSDELFTLAENNLKRKTEMNVKVNILKEKDLSIVKEMFLKALGLNLIPGKKMRHNIKHKNITKNTKINYYHRSFGTNGDQHTKFDDEIPNIGAADDKIASKSKSYLLSHKLIRNATNAVLVPLVERLVEVTNANNKNRKNIDNAKKENKTNNSSFDLDNVNKNVRKDIFPQGSKIKNLKEGNLPQGTKNKNVREDMLPRGPENKKVKEEKLAQATENKKLRKDNLIRISVNNIASDLATSKEKQRVLIYNKEIGKDLENLHDCAIHLQKEKHLLKPNHTPHERNLTCDYCEKTFRDKGSLIFHLVAHKYTSNTNIKIPRINTSKNNVELDYHKEFVTVCANKSEENETIEIIDVQNDSTLSEIIVNINSRHDDMIIEFSKTAMLHETLKDNDVINDETTLVTCNNDIDVSAANEDQNALKAAFHNDEATTIQGETKNLKCDICSKVSTGHDIHEVLIEDDISDEATVSEAQSNGMMDDKQKNKIVEIHDERDSNIRKNEVQSNRIMTRRLVSRMKNQQNETFPIRKENTDNDNTFICNECDKRLKTKVLLIAHVKKHSKNSRVKLKAKKKGITVKFPRIMFSRNSHMLKPENENVSRGTYFCTICEYKTTSQSRLEKHMLAHLKKYKCDFCNKEFLKMYNFNVHIRCHTKEKPFQCSLCDSKFARKDTLNHHLKTHTREKAYKCKLCTSEFKLESGLKRHLNIHAKDKKYKCTACDSAFSEGWSLKQHMKRHAGDKPYSCDICKYSTVNSGDLKRHKDTHAKKRTFKLKCTECSFSTNKAGSLKQHMKYHTGEKPYSCDICEYSTAHVSNLKRHKSRHSGRQ